MPHTPSKPETLATFLDRLTLKTLIVVGLFALAFAILAMIHADPGLLEKASFMQLTGILLGSGGVGAVVAYHFGSSQGSRAKDDTIAAALKPPQPPPDPKSGDPQ
jgi:hypothetical protein